MELEHPIASQTSRVRRPIDFASSGGPTEIAPGLRRKSTLLQTILGVAILATAACADGVRGPTSPTGDSVPPGRFASTPGETAVIHEGPASAMAAAPRSGEFYLTKECSQFTGQPGSFCTVTSSTIDAIQVGSHIIYANGPGAVTLDTDIVLDLPGPGQNKAFGHCVLVLATGVGECTLTGGTGKFTHFTLRADVAYLTGTDWEWSGTFSFSPQG